MKALRIQNQQSRIDSARTTGLSLGASLLCIVLLVASFFKWISGNPLSWQVWAIAIALPPLVFLVCSIISLANRLDADLPDWVEMGEHFSYRNGAGVHNLDWKDVLAMEFKYDEWYSDPGEDVYTTDLIIAVCGGTNLRVSIGGSGTQENKTCAAEIVQALVENLRGPDLHARHFAAKALGRLAPGGVCNLRNYTKHHIKDIQKDAREALDRISESVPYLREGTDNSDEVFKKAATDALRRLQAGLAANVPSGEVPASASREMTVSEPDQDGSISVEVATIDDGFVRVAFSGTAGDGSEGNVHGSQMHDALRTVVNRDNPRGIVIDVRNLTYRWGDYIGHAFLGTYISRLPRGSPFPRNRMCVVAEGETLNCLRSLWDVFGLHEELLLTDDEKEAIEYITRERE